MRKLPHCKSTVYAPSCVVIDGRGHMLRTGECARGECVPDWKAVIRSCPHIQVRSGGVPGNLNMAKMVCGRLFLRARFFYVVGKISNAYVLRELSDLAKIYPEIKRAGVVFILGAWYTGGGLKCESGASQVE